MSNTYCKHNNDAHTCMECRGLSNHASSKIINMANHNIKKAHDDVTQRLIDAKNGKKDEKSSIWVSDKDNVIYMHHQNTLISFTPEQAISMSEGLMTLGWQLKAEKENENVEEQSGKEPGKPIEYDGDAREGQGKEGD